MKQISDNDNQSIDGWKDEELQRWITISKYLIGTSLLINIYLIVISILYQYLFPIWFQHILLIVSISGFVICLLNIITSILNSYNQIRFMLSSLYLLLQISAIIFFLASFKADIDQLAINPNFSDKNLQQFQYFFISIIVSELISLLCFLFRIYTIYLLQNQENLMVILHFYTIMFLLTGIIVNYYSTFKSFQIFLLFVLIGVSLLLYGSNIKKIKVGYFSVGIILLCYIFMNQYQHFFNVRNSKQKTNQTLSDCPATLRNIHMNTLQEKTTCVKYLESQECNDYSKAFLWEQDEGVDIKQKQNKLGCLNLNCCGIVAETLHYKLNILSLVHQLIGLSTFAILMYLSQKPPLLIVEVHFIDFLFGSILLFLIIVAIFIFGKQINFKSLYLLQENMDSTSITLPQGCNLIDQFTNFTCVMQNCANISLILQSSIPLHIYRLSNQIDLYQYQQINQNNLQFEGNFETISKYIKNNIYSCPETFEYKIDVIINDLTQANHNRLLAMKNNNFIDEVSNIKFYSINLNITQDIQFKIEILNPISNSIYIEGQNLKFLQYVQEGSYLIKIYADNFVTFQQSILLQNNLLLNINMIPLNQNIQLILSGSSKSMLGASFAISSSKEYITTKWMGSNEYLSLKYIDETTQVINLNNLYNYGILIFILNPEDKAYLQIINNDKMIYHTYAQSGFESQSLVCLYGTKIKIIQQFVNTTLPNSLIC